MDFQPLRTPARSVDQTLTSLLAGFFTSKQKLQRRRRQAANQVEVFEDRAMLSAIVVTSLADNTTVDGQITLREAIQAANTDTSVDGSAAGSGADVISFAPGLNGLILMNGTQITISSAVTIAGNGARNTVIHAGQQSRVFDITNAAGDVTLNDLAFRNGRTTGSGADFFDTTFAGGAVRWLSPGTLTINRSTFTGNSTSGNRAGGGAILVQQGTLIVNASTFSGNNTSGINSEGGAISGHFGVLKISNSTISGNSTTGEGSEGGGVFDVFGDVTISQSTISGNTITGTDSQGGGVFTQDGLLIVSQSTITGNQSAISVGGGIFTLSSSITILNSIVAGNSDSGTAPDIRKSPNAGDVLTVKNSLIGRSNDTGLAATSGTTSDTDGNFIGGTTVQTAINPMLGPLQNNGGPTLTHAPLPGSLALDHGSASLAVDVTKGNVPLTTDQRGGTFARVLDGDGTGPWVVDIGAVESTGAKLLTPNSTTNALRPTLQWGAIAEAVSYKIWADNLSTGTSGYYVSTTTGVSQIVTSDFALGKYRVWIQPMFASGRGNWSASKDIFVLPPTVFKSMPTVQLTSTPTLMWNALPGAVAYDLWIDNVSTGQKQFIRQNVAGTSFTPPSGLPLGTYRAFVRGVDAIGNFGAWSVVYQYSVLPGVQPASPLSATFDVTPIFIWASLGTVRYEFSLKNLNTGTTLYDALSVTDNYWTAPTALALGTYRWWVIAVNAAGEKSAVTLTTDIFVGGRPTIITPVMTSAFSNIPTVQWKSVNGTSAYNVWVNRTDVPQAKVVYVKVNSVFSPNAPYTSYTSTTNLPAGTYTVWVQAISTTNQLSPWSVPVNFTTTGTLPDVMTPVANSTSSNRTPTFTWKAVANADHYQLWVSRIDVLRSQIIYENSLTTTSFTATTALPAGTFRVWVRAFNAAENVFTAWTTAVDFKLTAADPASTSPVEHVQLTGLLVSELDHGIDRVAVIPASKVTVVAPTEESHDAILSDE